ncbi:MAG: hypothetical protein HDR11_10340 [Lachnospiraceae bacterium]|nr:hypothetical protein [Lachnospiraceae bacterium]
MKIRSLQDEDKEHLTGQGRPEGLFFMPFHSDFAVEKNDVFRFCASPEKEFRFCSRKKASIFRFYVREKGKKHCKYAGKEGGWA